MYFVYILQSQKDQSYYTGVTQDVEKRLREHNRRMVAYSSTKAPFELVGYCAFRNQSKALAFEKYLKSGSGIAFRNKHLL